MDIQNILIVQLFLCLILSDIQSFSKSLFLSFIFEIYIKIKKVIINKKNIILLLTLAKTGLSPLLRAATTHEIPTIPT